MTTFKAGDKVKLMRMATRHEDGWRNCWVSEMTSNVGKEGVVRYHDVVAKDVTVKFEGSDNIFGYPDFVLELVKPQVQTQIVKADEHTTVVVKSAVKLLPVLGAKVRVTGEYPAWKNHTGTITRVYEDSTGPYPWQVTMESGPKTGLYGAFKTNELEVLRVPIQVSGDQPVLEPVIGARVRVLYKQHASWQYEGEIVKIYYSGTPHASYHVKMSAGPHTNSVGAFQRSDIEVLSVPVTATISSYKDYAIPGTTSVPQTKSLPVVPPVIKALDAAKKLARDLALIPGNSPRRVTADWVQSELLKLGYKPGDLGNSAGQIFKGKNWKNTGATVNSNREGNHGRRIIVWEYVGQ